MVARGLSQEENKFVKHLRLHVAVVAPHTESCIPGAPARALCNVSNCHKPAYRGGEVNQEPRLQGEDALLELTSVNECERVCVCVRARTAVCCC